MANPRADHKNLDTLREGVIGRTVWKFSNMAVSRGTAQGCFALPTVARLGLRADVNPDRGRESAHRVFR